MDDDNKLQNNQNSVKPQLAVPSLQNTSFTDTELGNNTPPLPQGQGSSQILASSNLTEATMPIAEESEKKHNISRVLFVLCLFILVIGGIIAALYFTKSGIFGEKRISTGNHNFVINENDWQVKEVDESNYSITLENNNDNIMLSITDNPLLSDYQYNDKTVMQALGRIGHSTSGTERTFGDTDCMVYDTNTSYQSVSIQLKFAVCNVANNYNVVVGVASQNNSTLEKYLNEGIKIIQTGQK